MPDGVSLDKLRSFIAAVDEGSFSAAARKLRRVKPPDHVACHDASRRDRRESRPHHTPRRFLIGRCTAGEGSRPRDPNDQMPKLRAGCTVHGDFP
jgi:hypothetical protein